VARQRHLAPARGCQLEQKAYAASLEHRVRAVLACKYKRYTRAYARSLDAWKGGTATCVKPFSSIFLSTMVYLVVENHRLWATRAGSTIATDSIFDDQQARNWHWHAPTPPLLRQSNPTCRVFFPFISHVSFPRPQHGVRTLAIPVGDGHGSIGWDSSGLPVPAPYFSRQNATSTYSIAATAASGTPPPPTPNAPPPRFTERHPLRHFSIIM